MMYFNINLILQRMRNRKKMLEWEKQIMDTNKEIKICRIFYENVPVMSV